MESIFEVKDYLNYSDGNLKIENNIENGAVVTISMLENLKSSSAFSEFDKKQRKELNILAIIIWNMFRIQLRELGKKL